MMHHPNMHHQPMSGHPPQHMPAHQGHPGHHQMPPHQLHRENRHVALTRVPLGPSQSGAGGHGHPMGLGGMPVHHQRPGHPAHPPHPHPIRAMHHQPQHHHSVPPPQQLKQLRRPYMGYGAGAGAAMPPPYAQPEPPPREPPQPAHNTAAAPPPAAEGSAEAGAGDAAALDPDAAQANSKEKTPMCLVNELARYNKIKHQYRLTSETGPAHKKVFTVTLRLGDTEEYTAEGSSIKRAQHAAAHAALAGTAHAPPPPRAAQHHPHHHHHHRHSVMPTVELNALAMKLCQPAVYTSVPAVARGRGRPPPPFRVHPPFLPPQGVYQRMLNPALLYRVRVMVGGRAWLGEGGTPQAARHDAAARALNDLRPANAAATPTEEPTTVTPGGEGGENENGSGSGSPGEGGSPTPPEVKSPVSLVHELALKRGLPVLFTVKSERGPPHMRVFVTICTVGDMETEGEGNGKKVSKRRAAERMLAEMRRRWPPALLRPRPPQPDKRKHPPVKKKPRNLIKEGCVGATPTTGATLPESDNPISLLAVARHALRARSPQYAVLEERGAARRREFVVRCDAPPHSATGQGPNKKTAKRRAAQNVLVAMELTSNPADGAAAATPPDAAAAADANKTTNTNNNTKRKDGDPAPATTGAAGAGGDGRQPVPGVLLMDYHQRPHPAHPQPAPQTVQPHLPQLPVLHNGVTDGTPATPAAGAAGAAGPANPAAAPAPGPAAGSAPGAKDQLMYLSQLLGFTVQFSDFPKRNHGEYLSLVSLSTEPPVMCHGGGPSTAHSHEQCSLAALRALKHMGLDAPAAAPAAPVAPVAPAAPGAPAAVAAPTGMQNLASTVPAAGVISNGISE